MDNSRSLRSRMSAHVWLKAVATPFLMVAFFVAYFVILRNPLYTPAVIPATALDGWIGFHPLALIPYATLWVYVCLPSLVMSDLRELCGHALGNVVLAVTGLLIFIFWPTTTAPASIDWSIHPSIAFLKNIDATGNACPSLHAAFAVFAGFWGARLLRRLHSGRLARLINVIWCLAIVYSTVATRQHVAVDALAGAALGTLVALLNFRFCPEPSPCSG